MIPTCKPNKPQTQAQLRITRFSRPSLLPILLNPPGTGRKKLAAWRFIPVHSVRLDDAMRKLVLRAPSAVGVPAFPSATRKYAQPRVCRRNRLRNPHSWGGQVMARLASSDQHRSSSVPPQGTHR
ncbi:hypothetical protein LshimejAT787_1602230 [Lyophyllum shimeji]|uniref:Uncharacterized protein n=1 Tax=Lyophyllum shimeji TaxID=47721 RepID=A0A9P3PYD2_LYOSH|nr:hypothetical protein LshimejAT787_1602230 [Lyophyllum shimeji]